MARNHISSKIINSWWLRRLLLGILVFALITLLALYMVPYSALRPFISTHIDTEKAFSPEEFFLEPTAFTVTTKDGIELKGEEFRAERAKGIIILTSGLYNPVSSDTQSCFLKTIIPSSSTIPAHTTKAKGKRSDTALRKPPISMH